MFYSHTLLARKTALGTVWCAAHLQHRLNKKDYDKTKIPLVVDAIMFGEVPLALRTSSYLLLGVVRIYSKQIDYLKHDFDVLVMELRRMHSHTSTKLTLPENAYQASFHSITLPETFELDALELDSDIYRDGIPDNHLRSQEEITLAEQVPFGRDAYVAISFDEDIMIDLSHPREAPDLGFISMEDDVLPPPPTDSTMDVEGLIGEDDVLNMRPGEDNMQQSVPGVEVPDSMNVQDFGPSNQGMRDDDNSTQHVPEIEVLREAAPDFSPRDLPMVPPVGRDDMSEPCHPIDENINQENLSPIMEDVVTLPKTSLPFEESAGPPTSATSQEAFEMIDTHIMFGQSPMELVLQPNAQETKPRSRKRKQFFDKSTVLTNKFLKKALEDSSDLLRERRNIPSTSLDVWKLNNSLRKDEIFYHPLITGFCHDLSDMFNMNYIATKCSTSLKEASVDSGNARNVASTGKTILDRADAPSPAPEVSSSPHTIIPPTVDPASASFSEMEIEHLRDVEGNSGDDTLANLVASSPRFMPSPRHSEGLGSPSAVITSTRVLSTPGLISTEPSKSVFETPRTIDEGIGGENVTFSDIPELMNTADEELYFLEADNSPPGSQGTRRVDSLSVRTRAVGRYLMSLSPVKPISEPSSQDLSLNNILEGKRRKLCARMFYEMLVLKSYDLIDVQQDEPYGDITLKLTQKLSKAQI
ncbi:sister chromatid cohesion 1 protein 3-like isoform X2 [Momordica charantia]|uniref:Sister chromatid cohesion 1 protein 3-like isoform X2 n=1 Tax=Momordica charantia TaxID=3673 RepID=A0A6J1DTE8_MOMCH|nr:sister chromatid cohesion 1 protein 3-like isoform X2 [Momordica charantia]